MVKLNYFDLGLFHKTLSKLYHILFILSPKGIGKTYSAVQLCLRNWQKNHRTFAYVFRYQVEIDGFINELKSYLPRQYHVKKEKVSTIIYEKDKLVGILTALSQAHYVKNIQNLDLIIYDEVISATNRYLSNELKQFYLLISNLVRTKIKWNVYLLGNFHNADNPYFNYFKMYRWKRVNGILTDGDIGYCEIKEDAFAQVVAAQGANFLTKYDEALNQKYLKGGFTIQDLNMIQQTEVTIMKTHYAVIYANQKIYVHTTIDNFLYFSVNGQTQKIYTLTLSDSLNYNNRNLNGKEISEMWTAKILQKKVIFENFMIKKAITQYLELINLSYEFK